MIPGRMEEWPDGVWCLAHPVPALCAPAPVSLAFLRGRVTVEGVRCGECGAEWVTRAQMIEAEARADAAGVSYASGTERPPLPA